MAADTPHRPSPSQRKLRNMLARNPVAAAAVSFVAGALAFGWLLPALFTSPSNGDIARNGQPLLRKVLSMSGASRLYRRADE